MRSAMRAALASYLEGGKLIWMMPLHLHVNQKSNYDDDDDDDEVIGKQIFLRLVLHCLTYCYFEFFFSFTKL